LPYGSEFRFGYVLKAEKYPLQATSAKMRTRKARKEEMDFDYFAYLGVVAPSR
jgi:hypothetical protein